jgi:hypothetical protein
MARGGYRENSGRKTSWASGCGFDDTKTIRVPKSLADQITEIAHRLDAGEIIGLDTESINALTKENFRIKEEQQKLQDEIEKCRIELRRSRETIQPKQLQIGLMPLSDDTKIEALKDDVLRSLKLGSQSPGYSSAKKACKRLIELLKQEFDFVPKS